MKTIKNRQQASLDYAEKEKNVFYLYLDCSSSFEGTAQLVTEIEAQTVVLKAVHSIFSSTCGELLHVRLENVFGPQQITNNLYMPMIPLLHDSTKLDSIVYPNVGITLSKRIPVKLKWSIRNIDGVAPVTGPKSVQLLMEYEIDKITQ